MQLEDVDPFDDEMVRAHWEAGKEAEAYERPYDTFWRLESARVAMRDPSNPFAQNPFMATENGEVLGAGSCTLPRLDNTHVALISIAVLPQHRRRGVGTALLERALDIARQNDRTTVMCEANLSLEDPLPVGQHFLEKRGFSRASTEIHRVLDLPLDDDLLDSLERDAAKHHRDYRIETFGARVPDEYLEGFCDLQMAFNSQAPIEDLDLEPEVWDEDRVRNNEKRWEKQGRHRLGALALAPSGEIVALTELFAAGVTAYQSGTLVLPEHRGHRLGLAVKLANLRTFQAQHGDLRLIHSWNGEENGPMVAINQQLGFRPVEYLVEMQRFL